MPAIDARGSFNPVRGGPDGDQIYIPFAFTTDGSGDETLEEDYNGLLSISRSGAAYTLSVGSFRKFLSCPLNHNLTATLNCTTSHDAAAGTVTFTFSADSFNSARLDGCLCVSVARI